MRYWRLVFNIFRTFFLRFILKALIFLIRFGVFQRSLRLERLRFHGHFFQSGYLGLLDFASGLLGALGFAARLEVLGSLANRLAVLLFRKLTLVAKSCLMRWYLQRELRRSNSSAAGVEISCLSCLITRCDRLRAAKADTRPVIEREEPFKADRDAP